MSITLDAIRAAADAKYGSYDIALDDPKNPIRLLNPLRLSAEARKHLKELQSRTDSDEVADEDEAKIFEDMIRTVAETPGQGDALVAEIGGDLGILAEVINGYGENTQVGEASASAN